MRVVKSIVKNGTRLHKVLFYAESVFLIILICIVMDIALKLILEEVNTVSKIVKEPI